MCLDMGSYLGVEGSGCLAGPPFEGLIAVGAQSLHWFVQTFVIVSWNAVYMDIQTL